MKKSNFGKFLLLWSGELVSSIGGGLSSFGLGVYVFNTTGSAAGMALVTLIAFLPTLLLSVPAGVLADRYDRRLLMMLGDGLSAIGIIYILLRMIFGGATLLDICIGAMVSSVFSSLIDPAYRSTVTDLLTAEEFSKASGLVSLAGSARYLISPMLAGFLLAVSDIKLLLIIDACTFILTVITTAVVKKGIGTKERNQEESIFKSFKSGFKAVSSNKGVMMLVIVSSLITCFMGVLQILSEPLILAFSDSTTLGVTETVCASGMLVSSLFLGVKGIKKGYVKVMTVSLAAAGAFMAAFGIIENIFVICIVGFGFFMMLPFANNCLDYLARTNIDNEMQGRAWGIIGFISQLGYVVAYGFSGLLADGISALLKISVGRGAAIVVIAAGILLAATSLVLLPIPSIRRLEHRVDDAPDNNSDNEEQS